MTIGFAASHVQLFVRTAARSRTRMPTNMNIVPRLMLASRTNTTERLVLVPTAATTSRSFSSAVRLEEEVPVPAAPATSSTTSTKKQKGRRRSTLETKDPLMVTPGAADRIKELLKGDGAADAIGIKLGVRRRGCNGLSYTLNYCETVDKKDIAMEAHGVKVFIEPMALFNIVGTTMDWEESELASEFTFHNPNSKGECGCGESFNV
jgi:iron-sulfur cluster assembly accessory protein